MDSRLDEKRKAVAGGSGGRRRIAGFLAAALALAAIAGYLLIGGESAWSGSADSGAAPLREGTRVSIPVSALSDGNARFYSFDEPKGVAIRYFVVKGPTGKLHTAFDACDACWAEGKGYRQSGLEMICQNCRRNFQIVKIGEVHGGCNPAPLKSKVENGKLVIDVADILTGRHYFDLKHGG